MLRASTSAVATSVREAADAGQLHGGSTHTAELRTTPDVMANGEEHLD